MIIRSEINRAYQILHLIGAAVWLACAVTAALILADLLRAPGKNAWQYCLIVILGFLACVLACVAWSLFSQNFKSIEITDRGEKITLKKLGRTLIISPEEIVQVRLEEKYLLYSFSTKPRQMLVIDTARGSWEVRSDIITYYDRVINYFTEIDQKDAD